MAQTDRPTSPIKNVKQFLQIARSNSTALNKQYQSYNQQILEGIIARRVTEGKTLADFALENPTVTQESMVKRKMEKKKVQDLTKTYIRNFDSLKHTFSSAPKPSFFEEVDSNISDKMRGYLREFNLCPSEDEKVFGFSKFRQFK